MTDATQKKMQGKDSFTNETPPSAAYVTWLLGQGDTQSPKSPLHRLGSEAYDAAPGDHTHDGRNSRQIFAPGTDIITGDLATTLGTRTALKKVITLLVRLGATDSTTN